MTMYEFNVTGREGSFPFDMLRYDECWPRSDLSSVNLSDRSAAQRTRVTIALRSCREPTPGRWESFGWVVSDTKKR